MSIAYVFLTLSGLLTAFLWTPYIFARVFVWGPLTFLHNYPQGFPAIQPEPPLWAVRAQRAHLNMVETMPAFVAVFLASAQQGGVGAFGNLELWSATFFFARVAHAVVYILGVPGVRTPIYLVSWGCILAIGIGGLV